MSRWNKEVIANEINRLKAAGHSLSYGAVQTADLRLLRAANRHFGSWEAALQHVGVSYGDVRKYKVWSLEAIVDTIKKYHAEGVDLSWRNISAFKDPALAAAAVRPNRFGSWEKALEAAGLDYDEIRRHRRWDVETVLEEIRERDAKGLSLRVSDANQDCPALVAAARRLFEGWYEAVVEAGVDELKARMGVDGFWDEETARGEQSWNADQSEGAVEAS